MRLRIRRSHLYLILLLAVLSVGWTLFTRLDVRSKSLPLIDATSELMKSEKSNSQDDLVSLQHNGEKSYVALKSSAFKKIDCLINNEYTISCLKSPDGMIHVPFNFIRRYFDIYGKLVRTSKGNEFFSWEHSYSKIYYPKEPYDHKGAFLWFDNYNVEVRDRVKSISGLKGVPISTQWEPKGHFYPIQIAQFGLSHFSKNLTQGKPRTLILEDGLFKQEAWHVAVKGNRIQIHSMDDDSDIDAGDAGSQVEGNKVLFLDGEAITFKLKRKRIHNDLTLTLQVKPLAANFSFTVYLQSDTGTEYSVSYSSINEDFSEGETTYGFGEGQIWRRLVRDLGVDLQKAYTVAGRKLPVKAKNLHVSKMTFRGKALIDNVILSSSAHESHFLAAVRWLMENQDHSGGWPIKTTRKLSNGALILEPGWYSAMAQGQAISLLTRMYHVSGDESYVKAAIRALALFDVSSSKGGFKTHFVDKFVWFEEYPTVPSSYVLNGFIYSLFGLYDLRMTCAKLCQKAGDYFDEGLESLKQMLPLYDTGSGTLYDLRHFSLKSEPKIARWDYHTTHINQLLYLNTIFNDPYFHNITKRWIGYMKGKRAAHN